MHAKEYILENVEKLVERYRKLNYLLIFTLPFTVIWNRYVRLAKAYFINYQSKLQETFV